MKYFAETENGNAVPVNLESVSPTGEHFIARYAESWERICLFRTIRKTDDEVHGTEIESYHDYSDTERSFQKVVWYEEYGFVKLIFHTWCTFDSESVRLYFDRELYEKKKKELKATPHRDCAADA